jgi:mono/diheme cytochrome c family protein
MFKRVVTIVEVVAIAATVAFVVLLFSARPAPFPTKAGVAGADPAGGPSATVVAVPPAQAGEGEAIFAAQCAGCHGSDGGGSFGPKLGGGSVVQNFPDAADEIRVVSEGRGRMPAFGASLTPEQIAAVVEFTRTQL